MNKKNLACLCGKGGICSPLTGNTKPKHVFLANKSKSGVQRTQLARPTFKYIINQPGDQSTIGVERHVGVVNQVVVIRTILAKLPLDQIGHHVNAAVPRSTRQPPDRLNAKYSLFSSTEATERLNKVLRTALIAPDRPIQICTKLIWWLTLKWTTF